MRIRMIALTLMAVGAMQLNGQSHPSFAGTWTLDPSKTIAEGNGNPPEAASRVIVQHGDTLTIDTEVTGMGTVQKSHLVWGLDGKAWKNSVSVGGEMIDVSSVLTWDNATLVIRTSLSVQGMSVDQVDKWTLAADGKSMTASRSITADGNDAGSITMTYVKKN